MELLLVNPRGFCAGVERAIEIVERALDRFGAPIYVRHEIVHNAHVVDELRAKGAVFVDDLAGVPRGSWLVFSAHGVPPAVVAQAEERGLEVVDATCPLVTKVHTEAKAFAKKGYTILLLGHPDHVEVKGVVGEEPESTIVIETIEQAESIQVPHPDKVVVLTQTTLSVDETATMKEILKRRFPGLHLPGKEDICYATQNRQDAVKGVSQRIDLLLVIGDRTSSNSNRLRELGEAHGVEAHLILGPEEIDPSWLQGRKAVGITSGASTPESSVEQVLGRLKELGATGILRANGPEEDMVFPLPETVR